ncbi:MAG: alkaline phosphatase family protein, partial [Candidatus Lokiarchaeota archaeon]|nr:alkaline phosphatase family protein [Candidatus Lokiarchaeota archaeon]
FMMKTNKLLLIGIDQSIPYLINRFLDEGILPNIGNLVKNGIYGEAYSCPPCDTPTNWTTIATGATTAIHGVTSFYMHIPGEPLDFGMKYRSRTQLSKNCNAEYIWNVAEKQSLVPFVMNYPSGWSSNFEKGAMSLFTWPIPESLPRMIMPSTSLNLALNFEIKPSIQSKCPNLTIDLILENRTIEEKKVLKFHIYCANGEDYDSLSIDNHNNIMEFKQQKWSEWIFIEIKTKYGLLPCIFRMKILKIDLDEKSIEVQRSAIYNLKGWTDPESFAEKLIRNVFEFDLPEKKEVEFMIYGSMKRFLKSAQEESITLARSIIYAKNELNWDLCYFHYHPLDNINHDSLAYLYKNSPLYTEKKAEKSIKNVETAYKIVDELVGELIRGCVDDNTTVVFVSDHGAIPIWKIVNIPLAFYNAGLTKYNWNESDKKYLIDWKKSVAFPYMEPPFVWVNLENRDPNGIVKQGDYEDIRDKIIDALYSIRDPDNNEKIIQLALKKEDASKYGLNGDRIGDVVYFLKPPYGLFDGDLRSLDASHLSKESFESSICNQSRKFFGAHAYYLPETKFGNYSISVPLIIKGPEVKKGITLKNSVDLVDLAPTLAHLLEIPKPKNASGTILHEIFN